MNDYSIEMAAERIFDSRTRDYFDEVYGCYVAGHYRSAVVMLWSVVVIDILFKLEYLESTYEDPKATAILSNIRLLQEKNPKSAEWETNIVSEVASETDLLDNAELTLLQGLQAHRHLSAHPVLTSHEVLFSPNKETVRAHIRNILDSVLTKPPFMSRKVFNTFIEDVGRFGQLNLDADRLKALLETKYFKHFSLATHINVFRSLWRVTFKSDDPQSKANRTVNRQVLEILFSKQETDVLSEIGGDRDWFSDVFFDEEHLVEMAAFFRSNPKAYKLMTDALKGAVASYAGLSLNHFALCWFTSDSLDEYISTIIQRVEDWEILDEDTYVHLYKSLQTADCFPRVLDIGIISYGKSGDFDTADSRFNNMVRPFLNEYSMDQFVTLLQRIGLNGQTYGRGRARLEHLEIKERIDKIDSTFDWTLFPNFTRFIDQ